MEKQLATTTQEFIHDVFSKLRKSFQLGVEVLGVGCLDYRAWHESDTAESGSIIIAYSPGYLLNLDGTYVLAAEGIPKGIGHFDQSVLKNLPYHILWIELKFTENITNLVIQKTVESMLESRKEITRFLKSGVIQPTDLGKIIFASCGMNEQLSDYLNRIREQLSSRVKTCSQKELLNLLAIIPV